MSVIWIPILALTIPIVAILGAVVVRPWIALQQRRLELGAGRTAEEAARSAAQTERLEQRMRVLERIVTDKGLDLTQEIERLRDDRVN
jgi:hypothetical protein